MKDSKTALIADLKNTWRELIFISVIITSYILATYILIKIENKCKRNYGGYCKCN